MTREEVSDKVLAELLRIGVNATMRHISRRSLCAAKFGQRGEVNVDFERRDRKIKICMYVNDGGLVWNKKLATAGQAIVGTRLVSGNAGLNRQTPGVLFKLDTGIDWESATGADIARAAEFVKKFKDEVSSVIG